MKGSRRLLSSLIAAIIVVGTLASYSVFADVTELTFVTLEKEVDYSELEELAIGESDNIEVKEFRAAGYYILLVPENGKTLFISHERITQPGIYGTPATIGSNDVKAAYLLPFQPEKATDADKVSGAAMNGWIERYTQFDTSVSINFDNIAITKIASVKFTLYSGDEVIGTKISEGEKLTALLKDSAKNWDSDEKKYAEVTGIRTLNCVFSSRTDKEIGDFWISSAAEVNYPEMPTRLIVEVMSDDKTYSAECTYEAPNKYVEDETILSDAVVTGWYSGYNLLDTAVKINFDNLDISEIDSIRFTAYEGETVIGKKISEGENLTALFKYYAPYWESDADNYLGITGTRMLSCAFEHRTSLRDDGNWVSPAATIGYPRIPSSMTVEIWVGDTIYITEYKY